MSRARDFKKTIYGDISDYLQKVESAPLLKMTLVEASQLRQLHTFIKNFIPKAFFAFIVSFIFKKPKPIPEAPISSWKSLPPGAEFLTFGFADVGWKFTSVNFVRRLGFVTPKNLIDILKKTRNEDSDICSIVLAPDWEEVERIAVRPPSDWMPTRKFVAEFRRLAKEDGIEVLTYVGLIKKYQKVIMKSDFMKAWSIYRWKLYLDFVKHFPMLAYSLCHDDYVAYRENKNRAELDLLDGKYPEAVAMACNALEAVLRIYYFMIHLKEAPDKELGWLYNSLKNRIKREMGEIYCKDLEFVLLYRPHAVHVKKKEEEITELKAHEVSDRVSIFCNTFFQKKWKIRI